MALVKILAKNLFAGAGFQKLEAGKVYNVDDAVADKWVKAGKAESTKEKGEALQFEVATPSAPVSADTGALQTKLSETLAQLKTAQSDLDEKDKQHADALAQLKTAHATELEAEKARADKAEADLAEATNKAK